MIGGIAAGCSAANLTDGLTTNSTAPVAVAQANQPYPGDRVVRPKADVGGVGILNRNTAVTDLPPPSSVAPVYGQQPAPVSNVSSSPLPPPTETQRTALAPAAQASAAPVQVAPSPAASAAASSPAPRPQDTNPQAMASSASGGSYTVMSGDTLYGISRKTGAGVDEIRRANGLSSDGAIRIGQRLTIPGGTTVASATPVSAPRTEPGAAQIPSPQPVNPAPATSAAQPTPAPAASQEEPKVAAYTPPSEPKPATSAADATDQTEVAALPPEATGVGRLRWPARGRVISNFGNSGGRKNDGIDIAVPEGTPIHAAENGVVIYAGDGLKGFGNTVLLRHEDGLVTVYGHASEIKVKRGDTVRRGQEIARSGMSGDADRPKLHFEVRNGTTPVDPMTYLQ